MAVRPWEGDRARGTQKMRAALAFVVALALAGGVQAPRAQDPPGVANSPDPSSPADSREVSGGGNADRGSGPESDPAGSPRSEAPSTVAVDQPEEEVRKTQDSQGAPGSRVLEEIVVTAQKREENVFAVPISIAAFSGDALEARGAKSAEDLRYVTPSLVYDNLVGYALIYMRGVGTEIFTPHGEPSIATYIDGIYFPFSHGLAQEFTKLERVEVLKGPQGTLFGRNATGGAINIISKAPGDDFEADFDIGLRNYDGKKAKGYVSIPLATGLGLSVSGLYDKERPYYKMLHDQPNPAHDSPVTTADLADNVSRGINPRLQWQATDSLAFTLSAYTAEFQGTGTVVNTNTKPKPLGRLVGVIDAGDRKAAVNEPETISTDTRVIYGNAVWNTSLADVKLLSANQRAKTDTRWDYDGGPFNAVFFWPTNQFFDSESAELQLISNDETPGSKWLQWTTGLYLFRSRAGFNPLFVGVYRLRAPGSVVDPLMETAFQPFFDGLTGLGLPVDPEAAANLMLRGVVDTESIASYANLKWTPTDWFGLTLGGRYQKERRDMVRASTSVVTDRLDPNSEVKVFDFLANRPLGAKTHDFSPRIVLDFTLPDDTLFYVSRTQAYKSGTFNVVAAYTPPSFVKPEKITTYEVGVKRRALDGTLRYTAAAFHNRINDLQTQIVSLASGGLLSLSNAATATIYGAEFDFTWQVLPNALPGLVWTGGGGYLHGQYDSFPEGPGFDPTTGLFFGPGGLLPIQQPQDFSGHRTVRTPKWTGSTSLSYTFNVPAGSAELAVDYYYNDGYWFDAQNVVAQPRYYTLGARASYLIAPWNLRVTFVGKNLTDQFYYTNIFATDFGESATGGPPPSYGINVSWQF